MLPEHSPFTLDQRRILDQVIAGFSPAQRFWLGGFLSAGAATTASSSSAASSAKLTILYGSESGNSEKLADLSAKEAKKKGFAATVKNMADVTPESLTKVENLLVIVATWGDGEPPQTATEFHKAFTTGTYDFSKTKFSVCALGDTAYEQFCQTGKDFDLALEKFGAKRILDRQDCDVEYEEPYKKWLAEALQILAPAEGSAPAAAPSFDFAAPTETYGKKNPFSAELTEKVLLNGKGSAKETWHYEISLEGSGLSYQPGDALAVVPLNADDMVDSLLQAAKLSGKEEIEVKDKGKKALRDALISDFDITGVTRPVLTKLLAVSKSEKLEKLLSDEAKDELKDYLWGRWIVDAVKDFAPEGLGATELASIFRKLPPRLYSISSSPLAHPGEVHLTIASVRYHAHGQDRKGVASTYLADDVKIGGKVAVYTHENKNFRLPASDETPIIMVGPGTGVAPFRAFVEHRAETGATGQSWLIFGDQRYTYDFLYQVEWQDHLASGALTKLDVAFSRDQPEKIYVQDRLIQKGAEIFEWLEKGAHFYVCGDASRMAHDVHEALLTVIETHGKKSREEATAYLDAVKKAKRYQRDVY